MVLGRDSGRYRARYARNSCCRSSPSAACCKRQCRVAGEHFAPPLVVCNDEHRFLIAEQLRELGTVPRDIVLEPEGRNTAPAATIAALLLARDDPDAIMALPSGSRRQQRRAFSGRMQIASEAARAGALVTFGIVPTRPETGYGYIRKGQPGTASPAAGTSTALSRSPIWRPPSST